MKSSNLLKPNKISYSKTNLQQKPKSSSRYPSSLFQKSSLTDPIIDKLPSKKNILGKQNQQKNIENNQTKRQSNPKLKKSSQLYINEKINRLNKVHRNQSMHIIRDQNFQDIEPFSKLNNSSINQKQNIHKKKKVSKPILDNLPSNQQNNSLILNRSSFSDKMILVKEKKQQISNAHFQSCKNLQSNKVMQQSKSYKVLQKRTSTTNKPGIYLVKNNFVSTQHSQSQRNSVTDLMSKNQNKSKNILSTKQSKTQQTTRKIKRTKLGWLILVNNLYTSFNQKSIKRLSHDKKAPTLFDLVHYLKNFQKKYHVQEQLFLRQQNEFQTDQKVTLAELLKFFKIVLNRDQIFLPHTVWKQGTKQIDSERTQISLNSFGRIIFSHESIIHQLLKEQKKIKFPKPNQKSSRQNQKQTYEIKNHNSAYVKEQDDIVQTARFQNHQYNSSVLHPLKQQIEIDKKLKKKNVIFTKDDQQLIYQEGVGNLISKKLTKNKVQQKKSIIKVIDKSFHKKNSLIEKKDDQKSRLKILQNSLGDWKSNVNVNKQQSRCSIEDISQILQVNENDKLMITSFNGKYNSKRDSSFSDPFQYEQLTDKDLLFRNSKGMSDAYNSNGNRSDQLALDQCRLQALNMNSSQLFLQSVILSNLYHTNFNISFSDQPLQNESQLFNSYRNITQKLNYTKLQDVVLQIQNILKSMKNLFAFDEDSLNDNKILFKTINKESIKIQDLTQMEDFLSQFIDYKVFRQDKNLITDQQYFNAVKLTQNNLTSLQTKKAAANVVKSSLISKYFSYFEAIRINQGAFFIQNIEMLIGNSNKIKILNLADNQLQGMQGLIKVIENNMECLQFLNLSNNKVSSLECFFYLLQKEKQKQKQKQKRSFRQLRQLHLKNNRISKLGYKGRIREQKGKLGKKCDKFDFPKLQLLDLRLNLIGNEQREQLESIVWQSPQLSIMSLKLNPIMEGKSWEKNEIEKLLSQRSIYQYDSLQMMSAYIKYKDITFSDSNEGCCSLIEPDNQQQNNNSN